MPSSAPLPCTLMSVKSRPAAEHAFSMIEWISHAGFDIVATTSLVNLSYVVLLVELMSNYARPGAPLTPPVDAPSTQSLLINY